MNNTKKFFYHRDLRYVSAKIKLIEELMPQKLDSIAHQKRQLTKMGKYNPIKIFIKRDLVELEAWVKLHQQELPILKERLETLKNIDTK